MNRTTANEILAAVSAQVAAALDPYIDDFRVGDEITTKFELDSLPDGTIIQFDRKTARKWGGLGWVDNSGVPANYAVYLHGATIIELPEEK